MKKFDYTNPHTWVWLDVPNEQGGVDTWGVEGMSPNFLNRRGWTRTTLKPGDKLTITIRPMKNGEKGGMWISAKRPDGEVLLMAGDVLVQRGTNHAWSNRTDEPAVVAFVLIDAAPL